MLFGFVTGIGCMLFFIWFFFLISKNLLPKDSLLKKLEYCQYSDTIRQVPENYMIAHRRGETSGGWICEPDLAANKELATKVFVALWKHDIKYGSGWNLISKMKDGSYLN